MFSATCRERCSMHTQCNYIYIYLYSLITRTWKSVHKVIASRSSFTAFTFYTPWLSVATDKTLREIHFIETVAAFISSRDMIQSWHKIVLLISSRINDKYSVYLSLYEVSGCKFSLFFTFFLLFRLLVGWE